MRNNRVRKHRVNINIDESFKENRSKRLSSKNPLSAVLYNDNDEKMAAKRHEHEREIFKKIKPTCVLDIGCGIARHLDFLDKDILYHGVDINHDFIDYNKQKYPVLNFSCKKVQELEDADFPENIDLIIISGVLMYLNDDEVGILFEVIKNNLKSGCLIYIREPIAINDRLTLDKYYSEELDSLYSAIYRTELEYLSIFSLLDDRLIEESSGLYPDTLNNRSETRMHYWLIRV